MKHGFMASFLIYVLLDPIFLVFELFTSTFLIVIVEGSFITKSKNILDLLNIWPSVGDLTFSIGAVVSFLGGLVVQTCIPSHLEGIVE